MTATYTLRTEAPVVLAGRVFTVESQTLDNGNVTTWLHGPRAAYFLRPLLGEDNGLREVISFASGAPLRDKAQRPVRVLLVGDMIEEVAR